MSTNRKKGFFLCQSDRVENQRITTALTPSSTSTHAGTTTWSTLRTGLLGLFLYALLFSSSVTSSQAQTIVERYGQLRVSGNRIVDKNGNAVQLRGMSLYWSQWVGKYYNEATLKWLRDDWKITVVRAAMAVDVGGYASNPTAEKNKVVAVVDAAIKLGIYVIIDFHVHEAQNYQSQATTFFREMATKYKNSPNVLYETWNEPLNVSWSGVIKPYHESLINTIRAQDPDNIIICGTRNWSQQVEEAALNPINRPNIAYTLHYYAGSHGQWLRDAAKRALDRGVALFVTEYGTVNADGKGAINEIETRAWWSFLDANKVGHANWSVADIPEASAVLQAGASTNGGWTTSQIKPSGILVRNELRAKDPLTGTPPPTTGLSNGLYRITARHSGKALDVSGYSQADGANVTQYTPSGGTNQQWNVQSLGGGAYSIRAVHSGKALDLSGSSTADGADINQWTYSGGNNQRWRIESVGTGYYRIVSVSSNKCIDIVGSSTADGVSINQYTCNGANNQSFQFQFLSAARITDLPAGNPLVVYPNPFNNSFTIHEGGEFKYTIIDNLGQAVENGSGSGKVSAGTNLPRGLYFLRIQTSAGTNTQKLIKN